MITSRALCALLHFFLSLVYVCFYFSAVLKACLFLFPLFLNGNVLFLNMYLSIADFPFHLFMFTKHVVYVVKHFDKVKAPKVLG